MQRLVILSGGQTGVDRGALDAALEVGVECGGAALTLELCGVLCKPVCMIDAAIASVDDGAAQAKAFVAEHGIHRLNVAGPRASHWPDAHAYARHVVWSLCSGAS